ncbi:MAG: ABC transporter ATP-binding protein [Paracoccaceae bacterium]
MIRLENLSLDIHGRPILREVSLDIAPGQVTGLVGESGSGKSMTALAMMGLLPRGSTVSGHAWLDGADVLAKSEREMCSLRGNRMGMIFQEPMTALNPVKTIGDQVAETLVVHGKASRREAREVARQRLARVGLPEDRFPLSRYPHELSGGQRQRVCIAMAVALNPELLIADEPTTALDVTTQAQILDLLKGLVEEEGMSLLLITHDLAVVAQMADTIKVLLRGEEVEQAPTAEMLENPQEDYTKSLWAVRSFQVDQRARPTDGTRPIISVQGIDASYTGGAKVLDDVSFDIYPGMTVAVVGESGSGKSTTARCITGLLPPSKGEILYNGEVLPAKYSDRTRDQLRQAQMIYQMADTALNPKVRISEIIGRPAQFYSGLKGTALKQRVDELLNLIELEPSKFYNRYPPELSGGQKQRIGIARALITNPEADRARRGGLGAGRAGARPDPRPARALAGRARARLSVHQPRSQRRARQHRPGAGDAGGQDRRTGADGAGLFRARPPLYPFLIAATPQIPAAWQGGHDA